MKNKRTKYNSALISFVWVGTAFLFLGQTPSIDSSNVERVVTNWDYQDVMKVSQLIDQITYFKNRNTEFENRYGGLLAPDNRTIAINQKILSDITLHLEKIREGANKKSVLKALESDFDNLNSLLLPPEYWGQIQEIKASVYHVQNKVKEIDAYSLSALALINSILPYIEELIESDKPITAEKITDVYFKVKSTQATLDLFVSFIENSDEELLSSVIRESDVDFLLDFKKQYDYETYVKKNIEKIIADSDAIKEYQRIKKEYYLEHYENLEDRINNIYSHLKSIHGAIQNELNGFVDLANKKVGEYIQESEVFSNGSSNKSGEYIDIHSRETNAQNSKYWIRAHIPVGTLRSLELQGKEIKNVPVSFALVYKIEHGNNGRVLNPDSLLGGKIKKADTLNWKFNNLTAEIPLGFSVENVRLTKKTSEFLNTQVYSPSIQDEGTLSFNQVGIHLPEDGPWTNYKQLYEQQREILSKIGVNEALGLEVTRVRISQDSLMPTLTVKLNSAGFLNSIIGSKNEFNTFEINLGKLDESSDEILKSIKSEVHKQAEIRLNAALNSNKELLKEILLANSVDFAEAKINNGVLIGKIKFTPKSFKIGDQVFPISQSELLFQSEFKEGKLNLKVSKPTLQYEAYIKKFLGNELQKLKGLEELIPQINKNTVFFNIIQNIQFDNFQIDTDKKQITTGIRIDGYDKESLPVIINKDRIQAINGVDEFIKGYVTIQLLELVKPQFEEECQSFFSGSEIISVFGEKFELESIPDCNDLNAEFKATLQGYPDNTIKVLLQSNGEITIVSFNAPKVLEKLKSSIKDYLTIDFDYIKFLNPRFQKGKLVFDCHVDIPLLNLNETVGVVTLTHKSNSLPVISFEGATTETLIKDKINSVFISRLTKFIGDEKLQLEFSDEGDGIIITRVDEDRTKLFDGKMGLEAKIRLVELFDICLDVELDVNRGNIKSKPNLDCPNIDLVAIQGKIVPGLEATVDLGTPPRIETSPIRLEGDIQINLHGMQFPSMGFIITKDKIEFHPNLSFPIPGALQIVPIGPSSPGLVLTNGNATLDLEKKQLRFGASMTVGGANTAAENSRLINMRSSIASYYEGSRLGDFELQANVILVSVLNVMEGKGTIKTKEGCFKLEASTKGPLRDVFKFDQQVEMNCMPNLFSSKMKLNVLGLESNQRLSAVLNDQENIIDLNTEIEHSLFSDAKLGGMLSSSLEIDNPLSFVKNTQASLYGGIDIQEFKLSGVELGVNYYNASLDFTVLGMELGIGVPNIGDITEGKILEQILSMLDFDPKAVLEILKDPTKIKFKVAPMGVGESVKSSSKSGKAGKRSGSGESSKEGDKTEENDGKQNETGKDENRREIFTEGKSKSNVRSDFKGDEEMRFVKDIFSDKVKPLYKLKLSKTLKGAIQTGFKFEYLTESVSSRFEDSNFKFGGYSGLINPEQDYGDSSVYIINGNRISFSNEEGFKPILHWRYATNDSKNIFVYPTIDIVSTSNPLTNPCANGIYFELSLNQGLYQGYFHKNAFPPYYESERTLSNILDKGFDGLFQIKVLGTSIEESDGFPVRGNKSMHHFTVSSEMIYRLERRKIINSQGDKLFRDRKGKEARQIYKALNEIIDTNYLAIKCRNFDRPLLTVFNPSDVKSIIVVQQHTEKSFNTILNENFEILDDLWYEIDESFLASLDISKNQLTTSGKLLESDYKNLSRALNILISDPSADIQFAKLQMADKTYQLWATSDPFAHKLINENENSLVISKSDLSEDLKIVGGFVNLKEKLIKDPLSRAVYPNLLSVIIPREFKYISKVNTSLIFMNSNWDFLVQKKDTLVHLRDRIQSNSYNLYNELQDGDRVNKPKFLSNSVSDGLHASFITEVVSIISKDTTTTAKIEIESGKLVGYFLSDKDFIVVWETDENVIDSLSIKKDKIISKIGEYGENTFTDERIITSIDENFSLEKIISYFKKGLTKTSNWYGNPDKIQSLIILL